ncbi:hypothetical protein [Nocardia donostiensis]|uniref:Uncharacterized protein n=1 Tax=Nocardia donostiensis TaxID=1538463 RepID=A0A1W0BLX0_9NOCA|nr:hypothetical protein [Nocardia donostiensis]ONM48652.1 hypothetical protein B0T46_11470 [Nocardia donostiensis]OQS16841.1 hypothetical protein B0T36_04145 [Nocardia donostiensis]OQS23306.1 hypothetical protein B0T44_03470 [Nocardia donostiensis]
MTTAIRTSRTNTVLDSEPLRRALRVDGWSTGVFGVVMLAGAAPLTEPLGLPTSWSIPVGVAMLGGALALLLIAGYPVVSLRHARAVVAVNLTAAVAMVALAFSGLIDLTGLGIVFLLIGAVTVSVFAFFEYRGSVRATGKGQ